MKKTVLLIATLFLLAPSINAATIKKNSRACINEEYFDQQVKAKIQKDMTAIEYLFKNGYCIIVNKDYQASVIDSTLSGKVKIRIYAGKNTIELWTYKESIQN